ncbi:MAG: flavodoxin [Gammaproteobacteria bacterium]|nr:flavodoxin [Gammaproteobacteria bacterium]
MKKLLVVYHSKTGRNRKLAEAVCAGAHHTDITTVDVQQVMAREAGPDHLLSADAVVLCTPENFGYMSGAMKDFFDRTFYEVEGRLKPLPCCIVIGAGNDGSGALRAIRRIIGGYPMREVQPEILVIGEPAEADLERCRSLGLAMAAGLDLGLW